MEKFYELNDGEPISPAQWCQTFYLLSVAIIFGLHLLPGSVTSALMDYGARSKTDAGAKQNFITTLTRMTQVPHSWFLHFYITSTVWSLVWAVEYLRAGPLIENLALQQRIALLASGSPTASMTRTQTIGAWLLMSLQGGRRLYESLFVMKPGKSPMLSLHWIMGIMFYTSMGISVWIEGCNAILENSQRFIPQTNAKELFAAALFLYAWVKQNQCHRHLAGLVKYTLPSEGWFQYIICPHYTAECLLYLGLSIYAAPPGSFVNRTVFCGWIFIVVNLGATAHSTKQWYADKFGAEKVAPRWKMIPYVF